jgi:hypothetical protein
MKNDKYIQSANQIEPTQAAQERMFHKIQSQASCKPKTRKVNLMNKTVKWLAPVAACLVIAVAATVILTNQGQLPNIISPIETEQGDRFPQGDTKDYSVIFNNVKEAGVPSIANDVMMTGRELSSGEIETALGDLSKTYSVTAYGNFVYGDKSLAFIEARLPFKGDIQTKISIFVREPLMDTVIAGVTQISDVYGTPVSAGYFGTDKNSKGISNFIYFASFKLGDISYYVELGGGEQMSNAIKDEITDIIGKLIKNGAPDFSGITE